MKISNYDPIKGETVTIDINVTQEQIDSWKSGTLIQEAMPNVSPAHREFIKTGISPESWKELWGET